jgi:hypothetical protein
MEQQPGLAPLGPRSGDVQPPRPQVTYLVKPRGKWRTLRIMASIFKVLAWLSAGLGVIAVLTAVLTGSHIGTLGFMGSFLFAVAALIGVGMVSVLLYSRAEMILLFIAIEENSRLHF